MGGSRRPPTLEPKGATPPSDSPGPTLGTPRPRRDAPRQRDFLTGPAVAAGPGARILGIDPGLVGTGYGLIESRRGGAVVLDAGVIETRAGLALDARLQTIYDGALALLDRWAPAALILEDLYAEYRFPRTALLMAHARGVICLAARQRGVALMALAPAEVKRAVAANGGAPKGHVQQAVMRRLDLPAPPRPSHVADALALALTGLSRLSRPVPR